MAIIYIYKFLQLKYTANGCSIINDNSIECRYSSVGSGSDFTWSLNVGNIDATPFYAPKTSFAAPSITSYERIVAIDDKSITSMDTGGFEVMNIMGINFGPLSTPVSAIMHAHLGDEFVATGCKVLDAHTKMQCLTAPGAGLNVIWSLTVDGLISVQPSTAYAPPTVTSIYLLSGTSKMSTDGEETVVIMGTQFGPSGSHFIDAVSYGPSGTGYTAKNCVVVSTTKIKCSTVAGIGENLLWQVSIYGQVSARADDVTFSYMVPLITALSPKNGGTIGGNKLLISGSNFNTFDKFGKAYIRWGSSRTAPLLLASVDLTSTKFINTLSFYNSKGTGTVDVTVVLYSLLDTILVESNAIQFTYDAPYIDFITTETLGNKF